MPFTEDEYEQAIIELYQTLGYDYVYGPDVVRDYRNPLYEDILFSSIENINRDLPSAAIDEAIKKLQNFENGSVIQKNIVFMDYLQNGISVNYLGNGEEKSAIVKVVDYGNPNNNSFYVSNQWTIEHGRDNKRPDVIVFLNGLPVVVIELKSPSRDVVGYRDAYNQIRNYIDKIPDLFTYNAFCVISDQTNTKAGTITSPLTRFMDWKTVDGNYETTQFADFQTLFKGMFEKSRLLDIIRNFICFSSDGKDDVKILAGYHQYFAVNKAVESTRKATITDGKGGVFWHTQGSGKSLSMIFYAGLLQKALNSPTIVVITDRNDLDDQLYGQFAKCKDFLRQTPIHAESRANLTELLSNRQANGIIFTTMQKFEELNEPLSERKNIIVMADEAHRGQYGLEEKVVTKTNDKGEKEAHIVVGAARIIRNNLPNATFIGFTGTPISQKDRSTREVFGDYIDIYDMTQAVEDGATRPVYYESRVVKLKLNEEVVNMIDAEYDRMAEAAEPYNIEKSKKQLSRMEAVLGADETINSLVNDIIDHYENYRADLLTGKAMIVAYSRAIAMKIYYKILELRPNWDEKVKVVLTNSNKDPEEWHSVIGNKSYKEELARKFKDNDDPMKIAIVCDMWLTGFDVPSLATMYVYKPMNGHNLMQAIARVNRVYKDKEGGLIVDYVGIASALKQAMNDYTKKDRENYGDTNIAKMAYPKFLEKLEICQDIFYEFNYEEFYSDSKLAKAQAISDGVNFLLAYEKSQDKEDFLKEALALKRAISLCASMVDEDKRLEAAYFEAVRTTLVRVTMEDGENGPRYSYYEINDRINELLKASIETTGVEKLTVETKDSFSLFDPKFLAELQKMKQKNLALEILKRLINDQIVVFNRTNIVKSEKFKDMYQRTVNAYLNGLKTSTEVFQELLELAAQLRSEQDAGNEMGLSSEELAFYDALTKPKAIKDFYENDELIAITRELTDMLRKNRTIDWQNKESARANMRRMVKRLLKHHKYPPDEVQDAVDVVIHQCELWTDNTIIE